VRATEAILPRLREMLAGPADAPAAGQ